MIKKQQPHYEALGAGVPFTPVVYFLIDSNQGFCNLHLKLGRGQDLKKSKFYFLFI